jgi:hypothetical protein
MRLGITTTFAFPSQIWNLANIACDSFLAARLIGFDPQVANFVRSAAAPVVAGFQLKFGKTI